MKLFSENLKKPRARNLSILIGIFVLPLLFFSFLITGCSEDQLAVSSIPFNPPQATPTPTPGPINMDFHGFFDPEKFATVTITDVTLTSPPVVDFTVANSDGTPKTDLVVANIFITVARLDPPPSPGDSSQWVNYIIVTETHDAGEPGTTPIGTMTSHASTENGFGGFFNQIFVNHGDGSYTYTFHTDVSGAPGYDASRLHRVSMELRNAPEAGDAFFDFVPNGGPPSGPTSREIVDLTSCNSCHGKLALHGDARFQTEHCTNCHTVGIADAHSGNTVDFKVMVHKIHRGADLAYGGDGGTGTPYTIWGYGDNPHDYSDLHYPQDIGLCTKCHDASLAADADQFKTRPTLEACGSCHDDVWFGAGAPPAGMQDHGDASCFFPGDQLNNANCTACHAADGGLPTDCPPSIEVAHVGNATAEEVEAARFEWLIPDATNTGPGESPIVTVQLLYDGVPYDIDDDPMAFFPGNGPNLQFAWNTLDFTNDDNGMAVGTAPSRAVGCDIEVWATDNGDGTFNVDASDCGFSIPAMATGTLAVGIDGHPGDYPVHNFVAYFPITDIVAVPRRQIVDLNKCNSCHHNLSLHGGNRQGSIDMCVMCHNPPGTDIARRPATAGAVGGWDCDLTAPEDGKREETIDFKYMIHAIHAGDVDEHGFREDGITVYGYGDNPHEYSEVRFPEKLDNCLACHLEGTYQIPLGPSALPTTTEACLPGLTGAAAEASIMDQTDDLRFPSADISVCISCHDTLTFP